MSDLTGSTSPRRNFIGRIASGVVALGATSLLARSANAMSVADDEPWLKPLAGKKHKQVFDAANANGGAPLMYAFAYMGTMAAAYKLQPADVGAIVVCRHMGLCLALNDHLWSKYKLGAMFNITDPATKAPAVRNIFYKSKPGDMLNINASADKLLDMGVVMGACNVAITALSGMAAAGAGVTPAAALAEWKANLHPGVQVLPSGVMAVGRAQESGCSYCYGGG